MATPLRRLSSTKKHPVSKPRRLSTRKLASFCEVLEDRRLLSVTPFTPGDLAVVRLGGAAGNPVPQPNAAIANAPTAIFIDEFTPAGTFVQSVPISVSTTSPTDPASLVADGTDFTQGILGRTLDGQHLLIPGQWASIDSPTNPGFQSALAAPRVIGLLGQNGSLDTSTQLTDAYSGGSARGEIRSIASVDGSSFYTVGVNDTNGGGTGGLHYVAHLGDTTSVNLSQNVGGGDNIRSVQIVNGNLFIVSAATVPGVTVLQVGNGLPTTQATSAYTALYPAQSNSSFAENQVQFFDLSATNGDPRVGGADTLYVANSLGSGPGPSVDKYTYSNATSTWTLQNRVSYPSVNGSIYGLTGYNNGSSVVLYLTTTNGGSSGNSQIATLTDTAGYGANNNGTVNQLVQLIPANGETFKGLWLVPSAAPVVTVSGGAVAYAENAAATAVDPALTIADSDAVANDIIGATVQISTNYVQGQDTLAFTPPGGSGITGFFDPIAGKLVLSGVSTLANYQLALRSVTYANSSDSPSTMTRTVSFTTYDVSNVPSVASTRNVTVSAVNDAPAITVPGAQTVGLSHAATFSSLNGNAITVADVDGKAGTETLTLSVGAGTLSLSTLAGLTGSGNGTSSLSYSGTLAALNTALNGLVYSAPNSAQIVTLTANLNDQGNTGSGGAQGAPQQTVAITVSAVQNQPPVVTTTSGALAYTENAAPTAIDTGLTVTDADDVTENSATVQITSNYVQGQDVLAFTNQNGITGTFDATSGTMTLLGSSSVANYQTALRSVTYANTSDTPSGLARTVTFIVNDGNDPSVPKTRTINVTPVNDAPVNTIPGAQSVARNNSKVFSTAAGNALSIADVDAGAAAVQVTLSSANGTIALSTLSGLTGSGNGTGSLTYSGTIAAINTALNGLSFAPTANFTGATTLQLTTNDLGNTGSGGAQSTTSSVAISVIDPAPLVINEILFSPSGANLPNQYIEIRAVPGLNGSSYAGGVYTIPAGTYLESIEGDGGPGPNPGSINDLFDLGGFQTGSNGILVLLQQQNNYKVPGFFDVTDPNSNVIAETSAPGFGNNADPVAPPNDSEVHHSAQSFATGGNIEAASASWFLYQSGVAPNITDDIDPSNSGTPSGVYNNWVVADSVGILDDSNDIVDHSYAKITFVDSHGLGQTLPGTTVVPVDFTVGYVARTGNTTGSSATDWVGGASLDGVNPPVSGQPQLFSLSNLNTSLSGYDGIAIEAASSGTVQAGIGSPNFGNTYVTPVVDINGSTDGRDFRATFTKGAGAVAVGNPTGLIVTNYGNPTDLLTSATIKISNLLDGSFEALSANTTGTSITASYSNGTLSLSGSDSLAHYQQVLRTVTYNDTATLPTLTPRTLQFTATDGTYTSALSTTTVGMFGNQYAIRINELDVNPPGNDNPYEYVEISGPAGASLNDFYFASVEGDDVNPATDPGSPSIGQTGRATYVAALSGYSLGSNGLLIIKSPSGGFTPPVGTTVVTDAAFDNSGGTLQNGSNSFFLIHSPTNPITAFFTDHTTGAVLTPGTDFDTSGGSTTRDNGTLVMPSGAELVDNVGWFDSTVAAHDLVYGSVVLPLEVGAPTVATRFPGNLSVSADAWYYGTLNQTSNSEGTYNSGLSVNLPASSANLPAGAVLTPGGANFPTVTNTAPTVDLNGAIAGTGFTSNWNGSAAIAITDVANATITDDGTTLASLSVALTSPHTGDVLAANTSGTAIAAVFAGGTLTLSGVDSVANYQTVLRSVTYNNTSGGPGVGVETATVVATDTGALPSAPATATINMPAPTVVLTVGAGSGTPNFTTSWYNSGSIPIENNIQAAVGALSGIPTLQSLTVTLATFHTGDVMTVPILTGVSITSSYSAGTLTLSGSDTVAHYQQELRYISYNNTAGGPGVATKLATFVANDGTRTSNPVTATINVNVATGQVLGNRLFYNNSKYDGGAGAGNAAINANDDLAIAGDKTAFKGTGTATFANVSAFTKGITGVMVDLQSGIGSHSLINLTSGDITFKVAPNTFATTTYNQLSNWTAAPTPTAISVRLGAGTGGSDRLEITWATNAIKNTWLEVNVHSGGNTGLSADDVFYFGSSSANSSAGDTALLAKTDVSDYVSANNNIIGLTTPVWNLVDYSKDGKVDISDSNSAINNVFTLHYMGNPVGPFAPDSGGGSAAPAAIAAPRSSAVTTKLDTSAMSSGLSILNSGAINNALGNLPNWLGGRLQSVLSSPPVTKAIQKALHSPQVLHAVDQIAASFQHHDDALEGLLAELGL